MPSAAFTDAYALYSLKFPTLASLGDSPGFAAWQAELDLVSPDAFDALSVRSLNVEGGNASGAAGFDPMHKVRALCARRAALDDTFVNPYASEAPQPMKGERIGFVVKMDGSRRRCCPPPS